MIAYDRSRDEGSLRVDVDGVPVPQGRESDSDYWARPPIPYHYGGYIHPLGVDPANSKQRQRETDDRARLEQAIFDLSQTEIGRRYLTHAYTHGFKFQHNDHIVRQRGAAAINDRPSNTLLLGSGLSIRAIQLSIVHEIGHNKRNQRGLRYFASQVMASAIRCVRAQEASSYLDEAEHAAECELITDPNHYKPSGVMAMFASYKPEMGAAALKALPDLAHGLKNMFRQKVHVAFYVPENLAFYDLQVIDNFKRWINPATPDYMHDANADPNYSYKAHMRTFMMEDFFTHVRLAHSLPYLTGANYTLDDLRYTALTDTPDVRAAYAQLDTAMRTNQPHTHYHPRYQHYFTDEIAPPVDRLLQKIDVAASPRKPIAKTIVPDWVPTNIGSLPLALPQYASPG